MGDFTPRRPALVAFLVFLAAGLTLFWPILAGQFMAGPGSDQFFAGYGFRLFGAEHFREYGSIPQWNPYLFGGLPFVAAMHGDVFYPTAWLRWFLPTGLAMNLGFAAHIILAGCAMYAFLRALGVRWGGAIAGGLTWELSGIVAGLVGPGHDGKLFVSALTPLLFLAVLNAVRTRRRASFGAIALLIGLSLHGHPQLTYYSLLAAGAWGAWLVFLAPERPEAPHRVPILAGAAGAVTLGFGLYAIQLLPFLEYIPFSPRGEGGPSTGWDYVTAYAFPPAELMSVIMPEFNGIQDAYWGSNPLKHHTEYFGVLPLALAVIGLGDRARRRLIMALAGIGVLFLFIAFGPHTPFYRLVYELLPMMSKARAPGMAYFMVAFPLAVFAGFGAERVLTGDVPLKRALMPLAVLGGIGVLGLLGVLQALAEAVAIPERMQEVVRNEAGVREGALRVVVLALLAGVGVWAAATRRVSGGIAIAVLAVVVVADLWSVERRFFAFQPPVEITYRDDDLTAEMRKTPLPFRVLEARHPANAYPGSWLMAHHVPTVLGYHGNEVRWYDELLGGKNVWRNAGSAGVLDLLAVRFLILDDTLDLPGWTRRLGPAPTTTGAPAYLYEKTEPPAWVRVVPTAVKVPEDQIVPTITDPRFPINRVVLFPDTASVSPAALGEGVPEPAPVQATLSAWRPGRMAVTLSGRAPGETYLLVSETWYPDWTAVVDGQPVATHRGQFALITVPLPPGAREVVLEYRSAAYRRGRLISLLSLLVVLGLILVPPIRRSATDA